MAHHVAWVATKPPNDLKDVAEEDLTTQHTPPIDLATSCNMLHDLATSTCLPPGSMWPRPVDGKGEPHFGYHFIRDAGQLVAACSSKSIDS